MRRYLLLGILLLLGACRPGPALPTALPTAALPTTPVPTRTSLPPTRDLSTSTPLPATVTPTSPPAVTATATPTPVVAPSLSINAPAAGGELPLGSEATVSGYGYLPPSMQIQVGLTSATGWNLANAPATTDASGWQATLEIPASVSGAATLRALMTTAEGEIVGEDSMPVMIKAPDALEAAHLSLYRPAGGEMVVAGHSLFFDGRLQQAGGGRLTLAVWDNCQTQVTDYSFTLRSSSYWQGYVILPPDISGPACAVVSVGEPGEEGWVAAQVPITLQAQDDDQAIGVMIANPRTGRQATGGDTLAINGIAYNAPASGVQVQVSLANGRIIGEATVYPDRYGFWEASVNLPVDLDGQIIIQALLGESDAPLATTQQLLTVEPGVAPPAAP